MKTKYIKIGLRIIVAVILLQTLRFKFTAHPDSVYIFTKVGLEPFGRIGIGIVELIAAGLILYGRTVWLGAALTTGVISGAILMHLTLLGIDVNGDQGLLFYTAIITFSISLVLLWMYRFDIQFFNVFLFKKETT